MSYSQHGKIEAVDFNGIVGLSTTSTSGELNAVWGTGNGNKGYGQTAVPRVVQNATVSHTDWANVTNTTTTIANHQSTTVTNVTTPATGALITYTSAIPTNITSITSARLNAAAQATAVTNFTEASTWYNQLVFTQTITFASGDAARYFFNAGGQIALTFSSPSGSSGTINNLMNQLALACGTLVLSSNTAGSITIAGTSYGGFTKVGGSGTPDSISSNTGYYALGTAPTTMFKQFGAGTPSGYVSSYLTVKMNTNGTQGSNGDNGSVITIVTTWDEVPNGLAVSSGTKVNVIVRPPSTSYLTNSWGTPSFLGSVTGS